MCWSTKKDCIQTVQEIDIDSLINNIVDKASVKIRPSQSVIEIGPVTLQMKGSGKNSDYHNMQFNASLNDLNKYI
jgi:hypothetical protein